MKAPGCCRDQKKSGFTIAELLIVVVIVGILGALAVPQLQKGIDRKKADSAIAVLRSISDCLREYRIAHGDAFPSTAGWLAQMETRGCLDSRQFPSGWTFSIDEVSHLVSASYAQAGVTRRKVALVGAGNTNQTSQRGIIYDCSGSVTTCDANTASADLFRKIYEMPAHDQEVA